MWLRISISLAASDVLETIALWRDAGMVPRGAPAKVSVGNADRADAIERWPAQGSEDVCGWFDDGSLVEMSPSTGVLKIGVRWTEAYPSAETLLELLSRTRFTYGCQYTIHPEWYARRGLAYSAPGFGMGHWPLGFACFFQGAGHERLVSRRWLDAGPWRVLRGEAETSFVQFHALDADPTTALEQARPGHERMVNSETGGFIPEAPVFLHPLRAHVPLEGLYVPADRTLRVVVHGRPVPEGEMLEAAARRRMSQHSDQPIDAVRYVFLTEHEARAHLHALWLRGLECWAIIAGREVRLDDTYTAEPTEPPAWARAGI